jgi:hypothetical protein
MFLNLSLIKKAKVSISSSVKLSHSTLKSAKPPLCLMKLFRISHDGSVKIPVKSENPQRAPCHVQ